MIKKFASAALVPALVFAGAPAAAATLDADRGWSAGHQAMGTFAGARVRLQLGSTPRASAALAITPLTRTLGHDGAVRLHFGEGLAIAAGRKQPLALTLAGTRVDQLRFGKGGQTIPDGDRKGMSTLGYAAIGAGVLLVAAFVAYAAVGDAATE